MTLRVFNTLTREKSPLVLREPGRLGMYVCGPTVYSYVHIGNARTFTAFDVVVRYLRFSGLEVKYVRNFTDVDDKIIQAAREAGEDAAALALRYIEAFQEDARRLKLLEPTAETKVTDHIADIIELVSKLIQNGVAYVAEGDVYFSVGRWPGYARLSGKNLDELRAGERVQPGERKREPLDFALWKAAKPGEPSWESPWGAGRPGWHIECSAMAARHLGHGFELHGGGLDLIFPHHENEIAQSEAASGQLFAQVWMHCGFVDLEGAKMSKSLGNVVRLRDALDRVDPEALRLFFLSTHYRNPLSFTDKSLADAEQRAEYFYETLQKVEARVAAAPTEQGDVLGDVSRFEREFVDAMDDDFNCPAALAALSALFTELNELSDRPPVKDRPKVARTLAALAASARRLGGVLGILDEEPSAWLARRRERLLSARGLDRAVIERLLVARQAARAARRFDEADRLRDELATLGVEVKDTPAGSTWKVT